MEWNKFEYSDHELGIVLKYSIVLTEVWYILQFDIIYKYDDKWNRMNEGFKVLSTSVWSAKLSGYLLIIIASPQTTQHVLVKLASRGALDFTCNFSPCENSIIFVACIYLHCVGMPSYYINNKFLNNHNYSL